MSIRSRYPPGGVCDGIGIVACPLRKVMSRLEKHARPGTVTFFQSTLRRSNGTGLGVADAPAVLIGPAWAAAPAAPGRPGVLLLCDEWSATATAPTATAIPAAVTATASPCERRDCRSTRPTCRRGRATACSIWLTRDGPSATAWLGEP